MDLLTFLTKLFISVRNRAFLLMFSQKCPVFDTVVRTQKEVKDDVVQSKGSRTVLTVYYWFLLKDDVVQARGFYTFR